MRGAWRHPMTRPMVKENLRIRTYAGTKLRRAMSSWHR